MEISEYTGVTFMQGSVIHLVDPVDTRRTMCGIFYGRRGHKLYPDTAELIAVYEMDVCQKCERSHRMTFPKPLSQTFEELREQAGQATIEYDTRHPLYGDGMPHTPDIAEGQFLSTKVYTTLEIGTLGELNWVIKWAHERRRGWNASTTETGWQIIVETMPGEDLPEEFEIVGALGIHS